MEQRGTIRLSLQLIYPPTFYANKDKSSISVCITADGLCMQHKRNSFKKRLSQPQDLERMGKSEGSFILCSLKMSFT